MPLLETAGDYDVITGSMATPLLLFFVRTYRTTLPHYLTCVAGAGELITGKKTANEKHPARGHAVAFLTKTHTCPKTHRQRAPTARTGRAAYVHSPSMSTPGLFVPTYGQPAKVHALGKPKINNRAIPSKSAASRPIVSKRSLMPSLVFNGKIEYVQVSVLTTRCSRGCFCCVSVIAAYVVGSSFGVFGCLLYVCLRA